MNILEKQSEVLGLKSLFLCVFWILFWHIAIYLLENTCSHLKKVKLFLGLNT